MVSLFGPSSKLMATSFAGVSSGALFSSEDLPFEELEDAHPASINDRIIAIILVIIGNVLVIFCEFRKLNKSIVSVFVKNHYFWFVNLLYKRI